MARTIANLVLLLLAAGLVIGASYALEPRALNAGQNAASLVARAVKRPAMPGGREALTEIISGIQRGQPDYSRMNPKLADALRRSQQGATRRLAVQGPLQSVTYLGGLDRMDLYRAMFAKGPLLSRIALDKSGIIQDLLFLPPGGPTQEVVIENYAQFPWSERPARLAIQLGIVLAAFLFGRFALRLHL